MYQVNALEEGILDSFEKIEMEPISRRLSEVLSRLNHKIVVLDDDPTGVQTVHNVTVYTDWTRESISQGFAEKNSLFFILTNSRGLTSQASEKIHKEIAENIQAVSEAFGIPYILVSRSDSILRGHYPLETEVLKNTIESYGIQSFDGEIICPFFKEGGRYTIGNVHYVHDAQQLVPAGETEFAKDKTFGYRASHLGDWIEEKTAGEFKAQQVTYISLEELRALKIGQIKSSLMAIQGFNKVVVNAIDYADIKVFVVALVEAILAGKKFIIRGAATIAKVLGNVSEQPLLTKKELVEDTTQGGLVAIGSYTQKTTAQFEQLRELAGLQFVEFNSDLIEDEYQLQEEIQRVIHICDETIERGQTVVFYTKRKPLALKDTDKENALKASLKISDAVTAIAAGISSKPAFIIAKGGITASEIGTKALGVKKALVMGQIRPGIPVWKTDAGSKFSAMPYIIFPGNVGTNTTLKEIVSELI